MHGGSGIATLDRRWAWLLAALTAGLLAAFVLAGVGEGAPPPATSQTFVLVDGPRAGDFIRTAVDGQAVDPTENSLVDAEGAVTLPDRGCPALHFTGKIHGAENIDHGCGQGIVVPIESATGILFDIALAVSGEEIWEASGDAPRRVELVVAQRYLGNVRKALATAAQFGLITNAQKLDLDQTLAVATNNDRDAEALSQVGEPDPRAVELVKGALVAKRQLMRDLPSSLTGVYITDTPLFAGVDLGAGGGRALNDSSQATGFAQNPTTRLFQPFEFSGGSLSLLPVPAGGQGVGLTVNGGGLIGGYTLSSTDQTATVWSVTGPVGATAPQPRQPIGTYSALAGLGGPTGAKNAVYSCTSTKTPVCVGTSGAGSAERTTVWTITPGATPVPVAVNGFPGSSGAFAINSNLIFGGSFFDGGSTGRYQPYIASVRTKKELVLWRPTGGSGGVLALNDLGLAGGSVTDPAGTYAALWWGAEHSVLGPTTMPSTINGVNNLGWAVGSIGSPGQTHAALFLGGRTIDLSGTVSGYTLIKGDAINNVDQILVDGTNSQGQIRVLLLTPASAKSR